LTIHLKKATGQNQVTTLDLLPLFGCQRSLTAQAGSEQ